MPRNTTTRRGAPPLRIRTAKDRCRRTISLLPATGPISEDAVERAIAELGKAGTELETELQAMRVRRAREAKKRIPRRGMKDARGRKRGGGNLPGYNSGREPGNKGRKYPPTPPTVNEVLRMLSLAPTIYLIRDRSECPVCGQPHGSYHSADCINPYGERMRALIYLIWRGGLRIGCEALRLYEGDLHPGENNVYVANGKNGKAREVVIDDWVWPAIDPWLRYRQTLPRGPLFCIIDGPTVGQEWHANNPRRGLHKLAEKAGITHRVAPHQFRHARAIEDWESGIDPLVISRNLGHSGLNVTDTYFKGLPQSRITQALKARPMPTVSMMDVLRNEASTINRPTPTVSVPDLMGALSR